MAGIIFRDITPLLKDKQGFRRAVDLFVDHFQRSLDRLCGGVEARGYIFGAPVAYAIGAGFIPIRKPGKLPYDTSPKSTRWNTAPTRWKCIPMRSLRATACWSSTTCSQPAAPPQRRCDCSSDSGPRRGIRLSHRTRRARGRAKLVSVEVVSFVAYLTCRGRHALAAASLWLASLAAVAAPIAPASARPSPTPTPSPTPSPVADPVVTKVARQQFVAMASRRVNKSLYAPQVLPNSPTRKSPTPRTRLIAARSAHRHDVHGTLGQPTSRRAPRAISTRCAARRQHLYLARSRFRREDCHRSSSRTGSTSRRSTPARRPPGDPLAPGPAHGPL